MKPIYAHAAGALALSFTIAACVPAPDSTPAPEQVATATPTPTPSATPLPPPPIQTDWIDRPQTEGSWVEAADTAPFATYTAPDGRVLFRMFCQADTGNVGMIRFGCAETNAVWTIRTETPDRSIRSETSTGHTGRSIVGLSSSDPILDAMALTRGRFAVEIPRLPSLYLPAWAEVTRVIEDCRK